MPRNKVLEKAKVSMPSGRNAFDLSQEKAFTSLCGEIGICYAQPFVAGTKGKISRKCFTRTADVVAPAFHRVTEHFDFFVVPIHSLWRSWENWKTHINDMQDTNLVPWNSITGQGDLTLPSSAPRMNFIDLVNRIWYQTPTGTQVAQFCREINDMLNLCDELRMCDDFPADSSSGVSKVLNLLMLGAYHKCYYDHYRNTAYESNNPYAYNFDWLYDGTHNGLLDPIAPTGGGSPSKDNLVASMLFKRHRVNYRNDYFHNIYPALNYVTSQPAGLTFRVPDSLGQMQVGSSSSVSQPGTAAAFGVTFNSGSAAARGGANNLGFVGSHSTSGISVQSIRAAFALDKLMRASAYAPKHVRDQYKAQYGVDGVEDFDMRSERVGSFQNEVQFTEVTNMAHTTLGQLGDLGAKGLGGDQGSKPIDFYCRYDSIVIGLHYFLPRARYDNHGLHPWNIKVFQDDFYQKAFENLGLRPFYLYNFDGMQTQQIGWCVPNFEYKILPDLNLGCFREQFTSYEVDSSSGTPQVSRTVHLGSKLSPFVPHTMNNNWAYYGTAEYFKVAPEDLDSVFAVKVPVDHARDFFQFYGDYRIMCATVAPMSVHGQPSL